MLVPGATIHVGDIDCFAGLAGFVTRWRLVTFFWWYEEQDYHHEVGPARLFQNVIRPIRVMSKEAFENLGPQPGCVEFFVVVADCC